MHGTLATIMVTTDYQATLSSNFGARCEQATASYKCNQGHGWIAYNHMYKTSLLKYLKISMDLSVASSLHGIKITTEQGVKSATSRGLVYMLVLVMTLNKNIHKIHPCKDGMA